MNFQINLPEIKKKIEIEDKLLFNINKKFIDYINELDYIKNNFDMIDININTNYFLSTNSKELENKLLDYPNTIYSIFNCFYVQRKNYIGMNLTGLVQGKIETGIGLRDCIIKSFIKQTKNLNLIQIIKKYFDCKNNVYIYKIKSNTFKWQELNLNTYNFFYIIINFTTKQYFILLEKL